MIVADYSRSGRVIVFDPAMKKVSWDYFPSGEAKLDHRSLAMELPNSNVILNDDYGHGHRVIVIDRGTKKIIWQYGVTDHKDSGLGELNNPDGIHIDVFRDWRARAGAAPAC